MAKNTATDTDKIAELMRRQQAALAKQVSGDGAGQQVMAGFADAYRAWLEAVSAKPESMMDLQGRYMQEQVRLWMESMQPNVRRAMQTQPVLDSKGNETGEYTYQGAIANRALELLGKQRGMFGDKLELAVTPEQAKRRIFEVLTAAAKQRKSLA